MKKELTLKEIAKLMQEHNLKNKQYVEKINNEHLKKMKG